jgi:hypothetical protein
MGVMDQSRDVMMSQERQESRAAYASERIIGEGGRYGMRTGEKGSRRRMICAGLEDGRRGG